MSKPFCKLNVKSHFSNLKKVVLGTLVFFYNHSQAFAIVSIQSKGFENYFVDSGKSSVFPWKLFEYYIDAYGDEGVRGYDTTPGKFSNKLVNESAIKHYRVYPHLRLCPKSMPPPPPTFQPCASLKLC